MFPFDDHSVDVMCAFSVFTHMEHEDTYRYLNDALRVVRPSVAEANMRLEERWSRVRNVTTSIDLMEAVARLAGWKPLRWYAGDQRNIRAAGTSELHALVQSVCVLAPG